MDKATTTTPTMRLRPTRYYTPRYRTLLPTLLILLCMPLFFYSLVPSFTAATDRAIAKITTYLHPPPTGDFCTREIGNWHCCSLYLEAEPCLDECRNRYVDRETFRLTEEYDVCQDGCLANYNATCQRRDGERGWVGEGTLRGSG